MKRPTRMKTSSGLRRLVPVLILACAFSTLSAQDFGFGPADDDWSEEAPDGQGFDDESGFGGGFGFGDESNFGFDGGSGLPALKANGEVSGRLLLYDRVFTGDEEFDIESLGDISGRLDVSLLSPYLDGFLNLRFDTDRLLLVDEAYARFAARAFEAELGLRKLSWGRADSMGPLDVINPFDYSDLTDITNQSAMKIARPMVHLSFRPGNFTRIEGVFVPWFRADRFDIDERGRWAPARIRELGPLLTSVGKSINDEYFDRVENLDHAQGGIRFTATLGRADLGFQYYTGHFRRPVFSAIIALLPPQLDFNFGYTRYHQIGVDYAQVLFGFNVRSELGINLTSDLDGGDPAVENPAVVYSLGFDRDLFWGINLNLQGNGRIRLMQNKIALSPANPGILDVEAKIINVGLLPSSLETEATPVTSTRITAILAKKILRDELELKATALWGIEDRDFLIIPAVTWTKNDLSLELSAGFFGGDRGGELGQYRDNSYVKTVLTWKF